MALFLSNKRCFVDRKYYYAMGLLWSLFQDFLFCGGLLTFNLPDICFQETFSKQISQHLQIVSLKNVIRTADSPLRDFQLIF